LVQNGLHFQAGKKPLTFSTRPEIRGKFGVAAATHWIGAQTALRMLELGGNAFDGAVAAGLVLQVVQPHLNGPGGDLVALLRHGDSGAVEVLCGQGPAPAGATIDRIRSLGHDLIPGTGLLPAVIPGAFDAWMLMLRDYGTLSLRDVLEPAIYYAESGFPVSARLAATINAARPMFGRYWPESAAIYLRGGDIPEAGTLFANPALAETWSRLLRAAEEAGGDRGAQIERARDAWYRGFVAEAIDTYFQTRRVMDVSGQENSGLLRGEDMAGWAASYEMPVSIDYHGRRVFKAGPWTQGPALLQTLMMLAGDDIAALDPLGDAFAHLVVEALKLAYADREIFYADPAMTDVPLDRLLSPDYAAERRALISEEAATDLRPGRIGGMPAFAYDYDAACSRDAEAGLLGRYGGGEPTFAKLDDVPGPAEKGSGPLPATPRPAVAPQPMVGDTCNLEVADRWGNVVAATPSGGWLQSSPIIPALGFPMGTRLQSASLDPRAANALAPGKRPRTTLSPTMVRAEQSGETLALGTPGGDQQDQWQTVFLLRHFHHGMNLQVALDAPSFHTEHAPNSFYPHYARRARLVLGGRNEPAMAARLRQRGHDVKVNDPWTEGRINVAGHDGETGMLKAAASPRGMQNYAAGR